MGVKVNLHPYLREAVKGQEMVEADGKTDREVLMDIDNRYPGFKNRILDKNGRMKSVLEVYVNAGTAYPETLAMSVNGGDEIFIITLVGGG